jgi:hypothetical protein
LRIEDQVAFTLFKRLCIDVKLGFDISDIEQELVRRNRESWIYIFTDTLNIIEIFEILTGKDYGAVLFTDTFHKVSDILYDSEIGQK